MGERGAGSFSNASSSALEHPSQLNARPVTPRSQSPRRERAHARTSTSLAGSGSSPGSVRRGSLASGRVRRRDTGPVRSAAANPRASRRRRHRRRRVCRRSSARLRDGLGRVGNDSPRRAGGPCGLFELPRLSGSDGVCQSSAWHDSAGHERDRKELVYARIGKYVPGHGRRPPRPGGPGGGGRAREDHRDQAFAISRGSRDASARAPGPDRRFPGRRWSRSPFGSG